jgi:hypothetical protein
LSTVALNRNVDFVYSLPEQTVEEDRREEDTGVTTSAAIRVMGVIKQAAKHAGDERVQGAWAVILGLTQLEGHELQTAISEALNDLRSEIDLVLADLRAHRVPDYLTRLPIHSALELTSPASWRGAWKPHRDTHLRAEVLVAWNWITWLLPSEDDEISPEHIHELKEQLRDLETAANDDGVPDHLRRFILRQASKIRTALARYRTKGIAPIKEALRSGLSDALFEKEVLASVDTSVPSTRRAIEMLVRYWAALAKFARDVKAMSDFKELVVTKAWPALSDVAEGMTDLLEHLGDRPAP